MMLNRCARLASVVVLILGCGGEERLNLVKVTGTATINGKPLEGAAVSFVPDLTNRDGRSGSDLTGPEGNYMINTRGRTGLVPGKYKVLITKAAVDLSKAPEEFKEDPYMAQLSTQGAEPRSKGVNTSSQIDAEFDAEVSPQGDILDFDVKAKSASKPAAK